MRITAIYAAILAGLFIALSIRVISARRGARVALGDGGDEHLKRRIRAHANFAEYVPFALILLGLAESLRTGPVMVHAVGIVLVTGRFVHAVGISRAPETMALRVTGMSLTFAAIGGAALACLVASAMTGPA